MNELNIKKIEVKNFLSVGNTPIIIEFNNKMNFVWGWNYSTNSSNGCGKTVLFFSAIFYALFGESGRDIKQNNLINYYNKEKMYVKLDLEKNGEPITIYRGKKPNIFYYIYQGQKYQFNSITETQNKLKDSR